MNNYLKTLISPMSLNEFLELYIKGEPFILTPNPENIAELMNLQMLSCLEELLNSWPKSISAHLPDVRDESSSVEVNAADARKLFANGMGLLFNEANLFSSVLNTWQNQIRRDLGLSNLTYGRCLVYATPDGRGTAAHFDQNINFVLQIHGTKIWSLAPNTSVINPMTRHTMGQNPDPELASYLDSELPTSMPKEVITMELSPGKLLFVPRGYWHSTCAEGEALALNFTYSPPTWLDIFGAALRSRLAQSEEWRRTAEGVTDPKRLDQAIDDFDELLAMLAHDVKSWRATDIIEATEAEF